jgi:hippurate hydrolase
LPGESIITGDTRALSLEANQIIEDSMRQIVDGIAKAHNIDYSFSYDVQTQMTINTSEQVHAAIDAAKNLVGNDLVDGDCEPKLFSEDFAQMLLVKPGCYILIGNGTEGSNGKSLHSADYDFNDDLLVVGSSYWATLVTKQLV